MGDELRHLNSACGCVLPDEDSCDESKNTCGCFGGNWLWIILIFLFFCCGNGSLCGITNCSINSNDFLTIILVLLILNYVFGDSDSGFFGGLFK